VALGFFLDGATATGWAIMEYSPDLNPPLIARGTFQAPPGSSRSWGWRWHCLEEWQQGMIEKWKPQRGAFEAPYIGSVAPPRPGLFTDDRRRSSEEAVRYLMGTDAVIEMVFARNHIDCTEVSPNSVKKAMTGHGRPGKTRDEQKRAMVAAAIARDYLVGDDNQADAIGVGLHVIANFYKRPL